jgi:hypothetical protein
MLVEQGGMFCVYARNTYTGYRNAYVHAVAPKYLSQIVSNSGAKDMDVDHFHAKKSVKDNLDVIDGMGDEGEDIADPDGLVYILVGAASASLNRSYGAKDDVETLIKKTAGLSMDADAQKVGAALNTIIGKAAGGSGAEMKAGYVLPRDGIAWANVTRVNAASDLTPGEKSALGSLF